MWLCNAAVHLAVYSMQKLLSKTLLYKIINWSKLTNLNFLSKVTEKAVASQIKSHIRQFHLDNCFQSAYKAYYSNHSTETILLTVQIEIFLTMVKQDCTALTLLDLSAAFDTIDHQILLDRLKEWFGLDDVALEWVVSYFKQVSSIWSNPIKILFGVPQGLMLGPLLFIMYSYS